MIRRSHLTHAGKPEYRISVLPLGGYVKMAEEPEEEAIQPLHDPRSFSPNRFGSESVLSWRARS